MGASLQDLMAADSALPRWVPTTLNPILEGYA
jgi:hypothetical protein